MLLVVDILEPWVSQAYPWISVPKKESWVSQGRRQLCVVSGTHESITALGAVVQTISLTDICVLVLDHQGQKVKNKRPPNSGATEGERNSENYKSPILQIADSLPAQHGPLARVDSRVCTSCSEA